jgi:hypothetical protein
MSGCLQDAATSPQTLCASGIFAVVAATPAYAITVRSHTENDGRHFGQVLSYSHRTAQYHLRVADSADIGSYCAALRLERRHDGAWHALGRGNHTGVRTCVEQTPQPKVRFDALIYPTRKLDRRLRDGVLRLHGFTDLGASIALRL